MELVSIRVKDFDGTENTIEIPSGINLSLMEALKATGYALQATCGGMALCATCHVNISKGLEKLSPPGDAPRGKHHRVKSQRCDDRQAYCRN